MERGLSEQLQFEKGGKALYIQIKDIYRRKILSGQLRHGDRIESESEIQRLFGVSRITARQAILDLEKEGMVNRGRGKGTFVTWKPATNDSWGNYKGFSDEIRDMGMYPGTLDWEMERCIPDKKAIHDLGLEQTEMYCCKRVRTANDVRIAYAESYYPLHVGSLEMQKDPDGLEHVLQAAFHGAPARIVEEIGVETPSPLVQDCLGIPEAQPVLTRKRYLYDTAMRIVEYTMAYIRGDLYSYRNVINTREQEPGLLESEA